MIRDHVAAQPYVCPYCGERNVEPIPNDYDFKQTVRVQCQSCGNVVELHCVRSHPNWTNVTVNAYKVKE